MATTAGPATSSAELLLGATTGAAGVYLEVQVPVGLPSLSPSSTPYVDPQAATAASVAPVNTTVLPAGAPGLTIKFAIPA